MAGYAERVQELIEPVLGAMGYELVGVSHRASDRRALLRIYIDAPDGITVDDCERVSRQVSGILDVEDPLPGEYTLEVSSPGLDRPLFKADHYARFAGHPAQLRLRRLWNGRRRLDGTLGGIREGQVILLEGETETEIEIPLELIESARLKPQF